MIAEEEADEMTQQYCQEFCQQMDQVFGPIYAEDDPGYCCDYESWYETGKTKCILWQTDYLRDTDPEIFENDIFYSFLFTHKEYEIVPEEPEMPKPPAEQPEEPEETIITARSKIVQEFKSTKTSIDWTNYIW